MKKSIFISDFDKTMTERDFYWIILDEYAGPGADAFYHRWIAQGKIGHAFLNGVFDMHTFSPKEHEEILGKIKLDPHLPAFFRWLEDKGTDFLILSAGLRYYVEQLQERGRLPKVPVISNPGTFAEGKFRIEPDPNVWFYSDVYGVDKEKVVETYKRSYETVAFAGDSEPDFKAAVAAHVRFAKGSLVDLLREGGYDFHPFETFAEIQEILEEIGFS
ncbi:MtnX-like HAD-IB family phosphatase [Anaerotalea alkaliphila]|uniref:MtnX-like HAD-IB family phosphatase n=1 Tax=Anaerotalea alkaliphila TaxID=2662126 RepID=A0A7X5KKX8_9FIRM|nr:MtnX-like HAD-IB family phosphatase [Anaerotalea alkaliphila]NDL66241.1 MtnX-like HAD-IB family phosphatase [Anaerotalea alkaliphila]